MTTLRGLPTLLGLLLTGWSALCLADGAPPSLPEPLTLEAALATIDERHPVITAAKAETALLSAAGAEVSADDDLTIDLDLEAHRIDPPAGSPYDGRDDSRATLTLYKRLYDFGRTRHRIDAAAKTVVSGKTAETIAGMTLRRQVMADYFAVLLADLAAATANEAMAVAYVRFDRAKDQHELGRLSEVERLRLEDAYQKTLLERQRAETRQRQAREKLALTLNRPGELSASLAPPALPGLTSPLPEYDTLLAEALDNNPMLKRLQARLEALDAQRKAVRAGRHPDLYLQLEANEYRQSFGSRTPWRAIVGLEVPLYQGGRIDAGLAAVEASRQKLLAEQRLARFTLRERLLQTLQEIETLQLQLRQAAIREDYRELYLDRSRARYELEIETDLGDAMVEQSAARQFHEKTRFDLALARERLVELTGNPDWSALRPPSANEESP